MTVLCDASRACQGILLALDQDPSNLDLRLILADAYEDAGEAEVARFWRWVHREKRSPHTGKIGLSPIGVEGTEKFEAWWWTRDSNCEYLHSDKFEYPLQATLPISVFDLLPWPMQDPWDAWTRCNSRVWKYYPSWLAAMEAALAAWQRLPYEGRPC